MSRNKKNPQRQVTIHLSEELVYAVDSWQIGLGLDSRAAAIMALVAAGLSAVPLDTAVYEILQYHQRERQKTEFQALADYFQGRANLFRAAAQ